MSGSEMEFGGSSFRDGSFRNSDSRDLKEQSFDVSSFRDWSLPEGMFYCVRWAHALMVFFFGGGHKQGGRRKGCVPHIIIRTKQRTGHHVRHRESESGIIS